MLIRRHCPTWNAQATHEPVALNPEAQDHEERQRQAVRPQLDGLPTGTMTPERPALLIVAKAKPGGVATQQNARRNHPGGVQQAQRQAKYLQPKRNWQHEKRDDGQNQYRQIKCQ